MRPIINLKTMQRIKLIATALVLMALALALWSCSEDEDEQPQKTKTANEYIYETFQEWYLWYDQIPEVDPLDYTSFESLIEAITTDQDRWSFAGSYTEVMKLFQSGEYKGFGSGFMIDYDGQIKITHVYTNSPMGRQQVERGWIVNSVNGYTTSQLDKINEALSSDEAVNFDMTDHHGSNHQFSIAREAFTMNTVLHSQIIESEEKQIGYLVFDSFTETSQSELKTVFEHFVLNGVDELIVDLRYNGGGLNTTAEMLIGMIGGAKVDQQVISKTLFNDQKSSLNESVTSNYDGPALEIDRAFFITTSQTASASEMVINALSPYMEVIQVGSTTHGKPVGMSILSVKAIDLAILPVTFKNANSEDYGDYYSGIAPNYTETDDLSHNWGDPDESMLSTTLHLILQPAISIESESALKSIQISRQKAWEYSGINQFINAW